MLSEPRLEPDAPWKRRYRAPAVGWTQIATLAPQRGLAASNQTGVNQFYAWDVPGGGLRQLTRRPGGMAMPGFLSPDGQHVYFLDDAGGNEIGHYVRFRYDDPDAEAEDITPGLPPYASFVFRLSRAGNRLGFMAADAQGFHIYDLSVGPDGQLGPPRELFHSRAFTLGPIFTASGEIAVVMSSERSGRPEFSLLAFDTATGELVAELWDGAGTSVEAGPVSPLPGDTRLLAVTNRTGLETLLVWNPRTGERADLAFEGAAGSLRPFDWSPDGQRIVFRTFNQAVQQLYLHHFESRTTLRMNYPSGMNANAYFTPDGREVISHWQNPEHPSRAIALDGQTGAMTRTVLTAGEAPAGRPWRSVSFRSSDGQMIQGWLSLPDGPSPVAAILETHGGPEDVQSNSFAPGAQAWVDHGFAYLTINYRGSTTFGRDFQKQIWGDLGHWEVEDMVAARQWLVDEGIAHPGQILLTGWSYGGYLTLMALGKRPELWVGGMAGIAIADWAIQYEDSAETLKGYQAALLGGTPEQNPRQYAASSPITYAESVRAPVLILQGRNDTRTPARPVEMYEAKLKALGKPVEVYWFDSGHAGAGAQVEQSIHHQELMLRFAYRVLGGQLAEGQPE